MAPIGDLTTVKADLEAARDWLKEGRPRFALAYLVGVDPTVLWTGADEAMAALIAQTVNELDFATPGLATLVARCARPPLARQPLCWDARARWRLRRGEVTAALQTFDRRLAQWPDDRKVGFARALSWLARVPRATFQYDPGVQDGALQRFVQRWALDPSLRDETDLIVAAGRIAIRLDPEADQATGFAASIIEQVKADPKALALRGDLEIWRGRVDGALPWYLWAAYTANSIRRDDAPAQWSRLSGVYRALGWEQHHVDAEARAGRWTGDGSFPTPSEAEAPGETCRRWHDWLIAYHPETLVRSHGRNWSSLVQDLQAWRNQCRVPTREPGCLRGEWHLERPRATAEALLQRRSFGREEDYTRYARQLQCAVDASGVLSDAVGEAAAASDAPVLAAHPDVRYARGLVALRRGEVEEALESWRLGLRPFPPSLRDERQVAMVRALARAPRGLLRQARPVLRPELDRWHAELANGAGSATVALVLARVEGHLDARSASARSAAEAAVMRSAGGAGALAWRGRLALLNDQPARALPWLRWADRATDGDTTIGTLDGDLATAYAAVGWWTAAERARGFAPTKRRRKALAAAVPGEVLAKECQQRLDDVARQDIVGLMARHGARWQDHVPHLAGWFAACDPTSSPAGEAPSEPIAPPSENR